MNGTLIPSTSGYGEWYALHVTHNQNYKTCEKVGNNYNFTAGTFSVSPYYIGEEILFGQPEKSNGDGSLYQGGLRYSEDRDYLKSGYTLSLEYINNTESNREPFYLNSYANGMFATNVAFNSYITDATIANNGEITFTLSELPDAQIPVVSIAFPNGSVANCIVTGGTNVITRSFSDDYVIDIINDANDSSSDTNWHSKMFLKRASITSGIEYKITNNQFYGTVNFLFTTVLRDTDPTKSINNALNKDFNLPEDKEHYYDYKYHCVNGVLNGGIMLTDEINGEIYNSFGFDSRCNFDGITPSMKISNNFYVGNLLNNEEKLDNSFSYEIGEGCNLPQKDITPDLAIISDNVQWQNFPFRIALQKSGSNYKVKTGTTFGTNIFSQEYGDFKFYVDNNNAFSKKFYDFDHYSEITPTNTELSGINVVTTFVRTTSAITSNDIHFKEAIGIDAAEALQDTAYTWFQRVWVIMVSGEEEPIAEKVNNTINFYKLKTPMLRSESDVTTGDVQTALNTLSGLPQITGASQTFSFNVGSFDDPNELNSSIIGVYEIPDDKDTSTTNKRVKTRIIKVYTGKDLVILDSNGNFTK